MRTISLPFTAFPIVGLLALASCEKEKPVPDPEPPPAAAKPTPLPGLPALELKAAAPTGDNIAVIFRFDSLRVHQLAPAAESILAPMPDYRRVFGGRPSDQHGNLIGDVFRTVILTSFDPRYIEATTLAARGPKTHAEMQALLAYADSGVTWKAMFGGDAGVYVPVERFGWGEPRVLYTPTGADEWTLLANRSSLPGMLEPPVAKSKVKPETLWPGWFVGAQKTETLARASSPELGELLVAAYLERLPVFSIPTRLGEIKVPSPISLDIAAYAKDGGVDFRAVLRFDDENSAQGFEGTVASAKPLLEVKQIADKFPAGTLEPLKKMTFYRVGSEVRWHMRATTAETQAMCAFAAIQSAILHGQPCPQTDNTSPRQQPCDR